MEPLSEQTRQVLKTVSTATISTLLFKRGLRNTCVHGVRRMSAAKSNMVGEAFTLRNIPNREDLDQVSVFQNPDHPQRKAYDNVPAGHVLMIDCRGDTRAASGGQSATVSSASARCDFARDFDGRRRIRKYVISNAIRAASAKAESESSIGVFSRQGCDGNLRAAAVCGQPPSRERRKDSFRAPPIVGTAWRRLPTNPDA